MNKKSLLLIGLLLIANSLSLVASTLQSQELSREERIKLNEKAVWESTQVVKTYELKYIKPDELINASRLFIIDATVYKNTVTVKITNKNVARFEEILKKIDVEKKSIHFKIYTIVALRESEETEVQEEIKDTGLKRVFDELKNLWNFKVYKVDSPSFVTVKEESGSNFFRLASEVSLFGLSISHVTLNSDKPGERIITIGQIQLQQPVRNESEITLIDSKNISVKENGFLVVGVSGINWRRSGTALILVISAEVKD